MRSTASNSESSRECWRQPVPKKHRHLLHPPTLETLIPEWGESPQANGEIIELQREAIKREMLSSFTWLAPKTTQMSPIFWKRHSQREPLYKATMSIDTSCCLKKKLHDDSEKLASNSKGKKRENKNTCSTPKNLLSFWYPRAYWGTTQTPRDPEKSPMKTITES